MLDARRSCTNDDTARVHRGGRWPWAWRWQALRAAASDTRPLLVSVITCPRPHGVSYLRGTIASVDAGIGLGVQRLLVCDGAREEAPQAGRSPRCRTASDSAARRCPTTKTSGGWRSGPRSEAGADLLFLEDDILGRSLATAMRSRRWWLTLSPPTPRLPVVLLEGVRPRGALRLRPFRDEPVREDPGSLPRVAGPRPGD